LKFSMSFW